MALKNRWVGLYKINKEELKKQVMQKAIQDGKPLAQRLKDNWLIGWYYLPGNVISDKIKKKLEDAGLEFETEWNI